jgi:enoyl-[acyl-carrier protein] reductase II
MGTRFAASVESSSHPEFKNLLLQIKEGDTMVSLKELAPVRLIKNDFYQQLQELYATCPTTEELKNFLGRGRAKKGMFEGDLVNGELEIGQIAGAIDKVDTVENIVKNIIEEFEVAKKSDYSF